MKFKKVLLIILIISVCLAGLCLYPGKAGGQELKRVLILDFVNLEKNPDYVMEALNNGTKQCQEIAARVMEEVRGKVGVRNVE